MEQYLVSYEYKIKDGCLISKKTNTEIFSLKGLQELTSNNNFYDDYLNIIFCQKL